MVPSLARPGGKICCISNKSKNMEHIPAILAQCPLFDGMQTADLQALLDCLGARKKKFAKNTFIFMSEDRVQSVGVVLSGAVHIIKEDFWGNRAILAHIGPGELFAESFSCVEIERLPVSVIAAEAAEVLLIDYRRIITTCSSACVFHAELIRNMLRILAQRNVQLTRKIEHLTRRTTREKLLSYLSEQALLAGGGVFAIPFNRQELADYLSVDRSALSAELGRMRDKGILRFTRNHFELLKMET